MRSFSRCEIELVGPRLRNRTSGVSGTLWPVIRNICCCIAFQKCRTLGHHSQQWMKVPVSPQSLQHCGEWEQVIWNSCCSKQYHCVGILKVWTSVVTAEEVKVEECHIQVQSSSESFELQRSGFARTVSRRKWYVQKIRWQLLWDGSWRMDSKLVRGSEKIFLIFRCSHKLWSSRYWNQGIGLWSSVWHFSRRCLFTVMPFRLDISACHQGPKKAKSCPGTNKTCDRNEKNWKWGTHWWILSWKEPLILLLEGVFSIKTGCN